MTIYTVHAPPPAKRARGRDETRFVFVKEGFCWPGLLIPFLWLIYRRMWIVLAFAIIALAAAAWLGRENVVDMIGWPPAAPFLLPLSWAISLAVPLLLGFEGNDLRRWSLGLAGYDFVGVVEASSRAEADIRFFAGRAEKTVTPPPLPPLRTQPLLPAPAVVGLFPTPGTAS